jgi:hypothetical protein
MNKRAAGVVLLLTASLVNAQTPPHSATPAPYAPNVIGTVSSVSGHVIKVANGTVAIDASAAEIVDTADAKVSFASVTPGSIIIATVKSDGIAANAPIPATRIVVTAISATVALVGPLTAIDVAHHTLTILGKTLQVTPKTTFSGPDYESVTRGLADIGPKMSATVQAKPGDRQPLVAESVSLMRAIVELQELIHGTVKNIASDAWRIDDVSVMVIEQTKIVGNPKVGDTVDVRGRYDLSNNPVAFTISLNTSPAKAQTPSYPYAPAVIGVVSSVSGHIIKTANGTVAIDASAAEIVDAAGAKASFAAITPGSGIIATVKSDGIAANAPIPATRVAVTATSAAVSLTGPLTAVDVAHNTLTILGKTLQVTPQTAFYSPELDPLTRGLADIKPNMSASVRADPDDRQPLVAKSVLLVTAIVEPQELMHGTVESIASDACGSTT